MRIVSGMRGTDGARQFRSLPTSWLPLDTLGLTMIHRGHCGSWSMRARKTRLQCHSLKKPATAGSADLRKCSRAPDAVACAEAGQGDVEMGLALVEPGRAGQVRAGVRRIRSRSRTRAACGTTRAARATAGRGRGGDARPPVAGPLSPSRRRTSGAPRASVPASRRASTASHSLPARAGSRSATADVSNGSVGRRHFATSLVRESDRTVDVAGPQQAQTRGRSSRAGPSVPHRARGAAPRGGRRRPHRPP